MPVSGFVREAHCGGAGWKCWRGQCVRIGKHLLMQCYLEDTRVHAAVVYSTPEEYACPSERAHVRCENAFGNACNVPS